MNSTYFITLILLFHLYFFLFLLLYIYILYLFCYTLRIHSCLSNYNVCISSYLFCLLSIFSTSGELHVKFVFFCDGSIMSEMFFGCLTKLLSVVFFYVHDETVYFFNVLPTSALFRIFSLIGLNIFRHMKGDEIQFDNDDLKSRRCLFSYNKNVSPFSHFKGIVQRILRGVNTELK
jgi:hypothetical protein